MTSPSTWKEALRSKVPVTCSRTCQERKLSASMAWRRSHRCRFSCESTSFARLICRDSFSDSANTQKGDLVLRGICNVYAPNAILRVSHETLRSRYQACAGKAAYTSLHALPMRPCCALPSDLPRDLPRDSAVVCDQALASANYSQELGCIRVSGPLWHLVAAESVFERL